MSVLRAIESRIEGLFEGVFGRAFRAHVQPVELARKLAKEMDEHRSVSVSRVYVPNEYTLYLSPAVEPVAEAVAATVVYPAPPERDEAREVATLTVDGRVVPLSSNRVVIGRSRECDVRVEDGNVSRRHAELSRDGGSDWTVVDLGSTNGTEVNGRRITKRTSLDDGDRIGVGDTELVFGRSLT